MQKLLSIFLIIVASGISSTSNAEENVTTKIVGAWKLEKLIYHLASGDVSIDQVHGGRWLFTPTRYAMMYVPGKSPRIPFKILAKPTDDEVSAGFKSIVFNSGSFQIEQQQLITRADIAKVPGFEGGQQIFEFLLEDNALVLTMVDEIYPDQTKPEWSGKVKLSFYLVRE